MSRTTNEWEFQGSVLGWLNDAIRRSPGRGLEKATQEPSKVTRHRSDLVVWFKRSAETAFLTIEIKTPSTLITDNRTFLDASRKAQRWESKFFAIWNMQVAELYKTPGNDESISPADCLQRFQLDTKVCSIEDWLQSAVEESLKKRAESILDQAWHQWVDKKTFVPIDSSVFVDRLAERLTVLKTNLCEDLASETSRDRQLRRRINQIAAAQGFIGFVEDINAAVAGQMAYRLIGQVLFYFALRRKQLDLPPLQLQPDSALPAALRPFWDAVRRYDYDALFAESELDPIVPIGVEASRTIQQLIHDMSHYDWTNVRDDVLGSVFEKLIPRHEQLLLGQFYTPTPVADLILGLTLDSNSSAVLDPGCGSGTFLMRGYDYLKSSGHFSHQELLSRLWGFDLSSFATELAAINLFRQSMEEFNNFPRIVHGDFFRRRVREQIPFPPAKSGGQDRIDVPIPHFDAIVGNPPYLRSQNQDDLDPSYRQELFASAGRIGVKADKKTDLFAFFVYHAIQFMQPGSRLGFITSSSWLTARFGAPLQRVLLDRFQDLLIIGSRPEAFFSQVEVNTVITSGELRGSDHCDDNEVLRFVILKKRIVEILPPGEAYWDRVTRFCDSLLSHDASTETDEYRLVVVRRESEASNLHASPKVPRNWSKYMRAPASYFSIFGGLDA